MIRRLLLANRGEIACRVVATARKMGMETVAVLSEVDAHARHVEMADQAVMVGPAQATESYLKGDRIIEAALKTGADAIHPGYGFLSENSAFAQDVIDAGLIWVGPPPSAIQTMGLKDAAKELMQSAGVPVVPGYHGSEQDPAFLQDQAAEMGYPVLIKARAGGGGKGMRLVSSPDEFSAALESARREAAASFGDDRVLVEKFVTAPRHIEIQVLADGHGNVVHLFERDCSLQRRHQKVIEEAPAPGMSPDVRAAMGEAAVEAARAVGYEGAGTVEFIADGSGALRVDGFWFMEMNTRLQVEHPVTEAITGLDLVEWQLRVAAKEALAFSQDDLAILGHAFEARIYAEDVERGFLPATGTLSRLAFPDGAEFAQGEVRIDSGVRDGDEISPWYDPMIAKVIAHGANRDTALARLSTALSQTRIAGTTTNLNFLKALVTHEDFEWGGVDTGFIDTHLAALTREPETPSEAVAVAALAALGFLDPAQGEDPWDTLRGYRHWAAARNVASLFVQDEPADVQVDILDEGTYRVNVSVPVEVTVSGGAVSWGGQKHAVDAHVDGQSVTLWIDGQEYEFGICDPLDRAGGADQAGDAVVAPMPGLVKVVSIENGDAVVSGDALMVLEAMKMEHTLRAPRDGVVAEVLAATDDQVKDGALLVRLEPEDG